MSEDSDLLKLKERLSKPLLEIDGISGLGLGDGRLRVYLKIDNAQLRVDVEAVIASVAPGTPIEFVVSGPFSPLSDPTTSKE